MRLRRCGGDSTRRGEVVVRAQIAFGHVRGCVHLGAAQCQCGIPLAQHFVVDQLLQCARERLLIVGRDEQRSPVPEFTQAFDVAEHERATRKCGVEYGNSRRFITRWRGIDRRVRKPAAPLRIAELAEHAHIVDSGATGIRIVV